MTEKFTERQELGLDPIVVYDQDHTADEEGNKVPRTKVEEPMWCEGVMCTRIENLAPSMVAFPCPEGDFKAHEFHPVPDLEAEEEGFLKLVPLSREQTKAFAPPTPEILKELELKKQFDEKQKADIEQAFEQFKQENIKK